MAKRGKRYIEAAALIDDAKDYSPREAVALVKKIATTKFDETVELHLRSGADPRQADQLVRGVATLPHGTGKVVRVMVFTQGEGIAAAEGAGADFVGDDEVIKKIEGGWADFDVSIATPDVMSKVGRLGRVLGRKGLMPNPRNGTVVQVTDIERAVNEAKKGRVEFRLDRTSLMHVPIGKASFEEDQLLDNLTSIMDSVIRSRPAGVKGEFILSSFLTTSMGPSIRMDVAETSELKVE
jgi:large subunit ribosomal protein L1